MILQELEFTEMDLGVLAVSIVPDPAIEKNFTMFSVPQKYYYTLKPEFVGEPLLMDNSHSLCKKYAKGDAVSYTENVIKSWSRYTQYKGWGFIDGESNDFFNNFPQRSDLGGCMFGCRHMLKKVGMFHKTISFQFEFEQSNTKPRRIKGPIMVGNKSILRPPDDLNGKDWGYVWFSNKTVEKLQKSYGINSSATMMHQIDISKNVIMTRSWLDKSDPNHWEWWGEYHILSDFVWQQIQDGQVRGFSIEVAVSPKKSLV